MLYSDKQLYDETCLLKKGLKELSPSMERLRVRLAERLGVNVINLVYDIIDIGPHTGRPRLKLILDTEDDCQRLYEDRFTIKPEMKSTILAEFAAIVCESDLTGTFNTNDVLVTSENFSDEAIHQAAKCVYNEHRESLIEQFSSDRVWDITGMSKEIVVFFIDNAAMKSALANGATDRVRRACYDIVKRYDTFDYITSENFVVRFDSKENLDKRYHGNLFNYFR